MPFFSIIIPVYNRGYILAKAVESCLAQRFTDFELIIVDDCSTDNSVEVALSFSDPRIKVLVNEQNQERCATRNNGIKAARGQYICFLDSDDYFFDHHLSGIYQELEKRNFPEKLFFVDAWNHDFDGNITERFSPKIKEMNPYAYFMIYTVNPPRWAVHRSIFEQQLFDEQVTIAEDMDFCLRALAKGIDIEQLPLRSVVYVASPDNFMHSDPKKGLKLLHFQHIIFAKPEIKPHIPGKVKRRLLAVSHYHAAVYCHQQKQYGHFFKHALKSLWLNFKGHDKNTRKDLLVLMAKAIFKR